MFSTCTHIVKLPRYYPLQDVGLLNDVETHYHDIIMKSDRRGLGRPALGAKILGRR